MKEQLFYMCEQCGNGSINRKEIEECEARHKLENDILRTLRFELTEQHIKLLKKFNVGWRHCEYGAPEINPKRPYGNSYVAGDIAQILGIEGEETEDGECALSAEQEKQLYRVHLETKNALEIVLQTGSYKPGIYKRRNCWSDWEEEPC